MARYVALVDGKPGAYGVTISDLPGCTSGGSTTGEALRNAAEAARLWAEDAIADGEELPQPRSAESLRANPEVAAAIDEAAQARGLTRSALLASAAREKIESGR